MAKRKQTVQRAARKRKAAQRAKADRKTQAAAGGATKRTARKTTADTE